MIYIFWQNNKRILKSGRLELPDALVEKQHSHNNQKVSQADGSEASVVRFAMLPPRRAAV